MLDLKKQIGVLGDSILKGVVFDEIRGTYSLLAESCGNLLQKTLGINIVNRSRFGSTIDKGRKMLEVSLKRDPDLSYMLLEYGGNDCDFNWDEVSRDPDAEHLPNTPLAAFKQNLDEMIEILKQKQIRPILMSLPPICGNRYFDFIVSRGRNADNILRFLGDRQQIYRFHEMYSLAVTRLAIEKDCVYVPMREAFLAERNSLSLICSDGIHPNEKGHRLMQEVFTQMALA